MNFKNLFIGMVLSFTIISCGSDLELPSSYAYGSKVLLSWETYRYDANGNYERISNDDAPAPNLGTFASEGQQKTITLNQDGSAEIDDYGDIYPSTHEGKDPIIITIDSQPTEFQVVAGGESLSARSIISGNFNPDLLNNNIWVSSMCGEFVNCQEINASEWLFQDQGSEGEIVYIVILEENYIKQ